MPNNRSVRVRLSVCEPGEQKPDFSLAFDLPEVPRPGDYISLYREDKKTRAFVRPARTHKVSHGPIGYSAFW